MTRILFIGPTWHGSNATSLRNALLRLGLECFTLDTTPFKNSIAFQVRRKLRGTTAAELHRVPLSNLVERTFRAVRPDCVLGFRVLWLDRSVVESMSRAAMTIHYHPDDTANPENISPTYATAESAWSLNVTTKRLNVAELSERGCRDVLFVPCAYDRDWHVPSSSRAIRQPYAVAFIGTRRPDRAPLITRLAGVYRKGLLVCGAEWARSPRLRARASVRPPQYGLAMSQAVWSARAVLGLLNSANRDTHTCRSFEIPAAGGLLVAERTSEHEAMLEGGREALFFSTEDELRSHLEFASRHHVVSSRIAVAGYERITRGGNTYEDRATAILHAAGVRTQ
jgi:hypothetical protein